MQQKILELLSARKGHFLLESGHHGDLWLDLEMLCLCPKFVEEIAFELADLIAPMGVEMVCSPLVEGAFVGLLAALRLNVEFVHAERFARPSEDGLFPAGYRVPAPLREKVRGRRVAIVNDVINAGSAVIGSYADLRSCGAEVVAIGALLILGLAASKFAASTGVVLTSLATMPNDLWTPQDCPHCALGVPLEDIGSFASSLPTQGHHNNS